MEASEAVERLRGIAKTMKVLDAADVGPWTDQDWEALIALLEERERLREALRQIDDNEFALSSDACEIARAALNPTPDPNQEGA